MRSRGSSGAWLRGAAVALCVAAPAVQAAGEDLNIRGLNLEKTITCDERDVVIEGANHRLTLRGRCQHVGLHGTGNVVRVEALGSAEVDGLNNRLEWERALRGERPNIQVSGVNNRAVRAEGRAAGRGETVDSDTSSVAVEGRNGGRVVVGPGGISVEGKSKRGRDGQVTVGADGQVTVGGGAGQVTVTGGGAGVEVDGRRGSVSVGAEPGSSRSLTIAESDVQRAFDCAGGSAVVAGSDNQLSLSRCRELTVTGSDNQIVLLGPVRLIRLLGADNNVQWSEGEGGKPPKVETPGADNRVWRK